MSSKDLICVGAIGGAYGVRGDVRLKSFCAEPAAIADYSPLTDEKGVRRFDVTLIGQTTNALTARIENIGSKEAADALKGTRLFAHRDRLPSLPDDEYYHTDLIGLDVYDTGGTLLGQVSEVQNHGAADLLEVRVMGLREGVLLPFTLEAVPTVDLATGRIIADPPDGLFPASTPDE